MECSNYIKSLLAVGVHPTPDKGQGQLLPTPPQHGQRLGFPKATGFIQLGRLYDKMI